MTVDAKNGGASNNDSFDINELAYLDEEITPEFIEQLQHNVAKSANKLNGGEDGKLDVNMFEEPQPEPSVVSAQSNESYMEKNLSDVNEEIVNNKIDAEESAVEKEQVTETENPLQEQTEKNPEEIDSAENKELEINKNIDDNFIKKYKAKLNKKPQETDDADFNLRDRSDPRYAQQADEDENKSIEDLSQGKITERQITQSQLDYNESLDAVDDNIKYSKYIIYIEPENTEFMDSLTVKERKNLINKILREQGNLILSKKNADFIKSVFKHLFLAIITVSIMIPVVYKIFNFSLEATIDNYRRSQSNFQTLYKEHGKIKQGY